MEEFGVFVSLGIDHILDFNGLDHLLFVIVLTVSQGFSNWKKTALLITAFTIGHCFSLILSGLHIINIKQNLVETLIPITILLTALLNILIKEKNDSFKLEYGIASFFGLIHGLGFSNYFKSISFDDSGVIKQLLGFNIGVEIAQLLIVSLVMTVEFVLIKHLNVNDRHWMKIVSILIALWALKMIFTN